MNLKIYRLVARLLLVSILFPGYILAEPKEPDSKLITAGWLEKIYLQPWNIRMRAKLDTGAKTSSLHAINIKQFKRGDVLWVRFRTGASKLFTIEAPLIREVKIKDHKLKAAVRPVVEMTFCLHDKLFTSEFSLIDRNQFNYPILLGRTMLQQGIIVDPSMTFTNKSNKKDCEKLVRTDADGR